MTYVGSRPANKAVTTSDIEDDAITSAKIAAGVVVASDIADDSITLAKMAAGTDGNIISYDASGNPVAIATGNDGMVLTSTGAGSPPAFEAASGTTINNNADNKVITGSGTANTLEGETNFIYNGTIVGAGATGASADLGVGLHVRTADSGGSANANANQIVIENDQNCGMQFLGAGNHRICFGDADDDDVGRIMYSHGSSNYMNFRTNGAERMRILSDGTITMSTTGSIPSNAGGIHVVRGDGQNGTIGHFQSDSSANYDSNIINTVCSNTSTNATYNFYRAQSNVFKYAVRDSGNVVNVNNSYGASSDERIKQDITDASSQWEDIKALKIRNFKLKSDTTKTHIGVVAQELETANMNGLVEDAKPEKEDVAYHSDFGTIVSGTADNGATPIKDDDDKITGYEDVFTEGQKVKSVKYSVLYMKAIKALQEAMTKIESLETRVKTLEDA